MGQTQSGQAHNEDLLRHVERRSSKVGLEQDYPMWVMPLDEFLKMDHLEPHQKLKAAGKLMKWTPDLRRPVLFLSHQWLSFRHPDPQMVQVRTFQGLLQRLMSGVMDISLCMLHKCGFDQVPSINGAHWQEVLPKAVVWMDYMSMPQPGADDVADAAGSAQTSATMRWKLASELEKAVRSIPSYVENSEYFFVLAPHAEHFNLDSVVDNETWASRGWCRMEAQARGLSTEGGPVIMVHSDKRAEMMIPAEWYKTPVGKGGFACCDLGHKLETSPGQFIDIPCDKHKVASVLQTMFDSKSKNLQEGGKLLEWRWLKSRRATLFAGLPHPYAAVEPMKVEEFLKEYKFTNVHDDEDSGWTPLRFAVLAKDDNLVQELISLGAKIECSLAHHTLALYHQKGCTILQTAAMFGTSKGIGALVDAGANLTATLGH